MIKFPQWMLMTTLYDLKVVGLSGHLSPQVFQDLKLQSTRLLHHQNDWEPLAYRTLAP